MRAKDIVAEIARSREYGELVEYWRLVSGDTDLLTAEAWEPIKELLDILEEKIGIEGESFLAQVTRSYRPKGCPPDKIYSRAVKNTDAAGDAFLRQVKQQMPVYFNLMMIKMGTEEKQQEQAPEEAAAILLN